MYIPCLLYTSDAADEGLGVDLGGRRIIKKIFFKQKTAYEMLRSLVGSEMCIRDSFKGRNLDEKKLQRAVDLSIEKYCGVMEMFRRFAKLNIETRYHHS